MSDSVDVVKVEDIVNNDDLLSSMIYLWGVCGYEHTFAAPRPRRAKQISRMISENIFGAILCELFAGKSVRIKGFCDIVPRKKRVKPIITNKDCDRILINVIPARSDFIKKLRKDSGFNKAC